MVNKILFKLQKNFLSCFCVFSLEIRLPIPLSSNLTVRETPSSYTLRGSIITIPPFTFVIFDTQDETKEKILYGLEFIFGDRKGYGVPTNPESMYNFVVDCIPGFRNIHGK